MTKMNVVRVFTDEKGEFGNPLGVVLDLKNEMDAHRRQQVTASSGLSEVVFLNNLEEKSISIYSPQREIPFAGHAAVGAAYFLAHQFKTSVTKLMGTEGVIETWQEGELTWVRGALSTTPPWWHEKLETAEELEALRSPQSPNQGHVQLWAWIDEHKGIVRARTFAADWGIPEDEANGSGSMRLAAALGRSLIIHHGKGSIIHARPAKPGYAEVGGRVKMMGENSVLETSHFFGVNPATTV